MQSTQLYSLIYISHDSIYRLSDYQTEMPYNPISWTKKIDWCNVALCIGRESKCTIKFKPNPSKVYLIVKEYYMAILHVRTDVYILICTSYRY